MTETGNVFYKRHAQFSWALLIYTATASSVVL